MGRPLCSIDMRESGTWEHVQKLTLCRKLLERACDEYNETHGMRIEIDERNFSTAFFAWLDGIACNADYRTKNAPDYFQFVFGVLLRELLHKRAVRVMADASHRLQPSADNVGDWWPAGYMLTHFCFRVLKQTVQQECGLEIKPAAPPWKPSVWRSFRENLVEEPGLAIAFFDKFMGLEPNWREPTQVANRPTAAQCGNS